VFVCFEGYLVLRYNYGKHDLLTHSGGMKLYMHEVDFRLLCGSLRPEKAPEADAHDVKSCNV